MTDDERDDAIASRVRAHLERTSHELDARSRAQLRAAREQALDAAPAPREVWPRRAVLAGAGALAVLVALMRWRRESPPRDPFGESLEDLDILAAADDLELYDDDPEFYRWLEESEPI